MNGSRFFSVPLVLILLAFVFLINMTFAPLLPGWSLLLIRLALILVFGSLWWISVKGAFTPSWSNLFYLLSVLNIAFLIVSFFTAENWELDLTRPAGVALAKLSDSVVISCILIVGVLVMDWEPKDIFLDKGKFRLGTTMGVLSFLLMGYLAMMNPENPITIEFLKTHWVWILIFIFFNAFMEELLFRGIFFKTLNQLLSPGWTILITSLVFSAAHMQVAYTQETTIFLMITFLFGLIWGTLMWKTRSLIGSVLFHAGADLFLIVPIFQSFH